MTLWRYLIAVTAAGLAFGVARAWWDVGSFDPMRPLAAFEYPADDEPDYWQVPVNRRAKATFDSLQFGFGKLEIGRKMRHVFHVKNEGDFPLVLAQRETSCVCTLAALAGRPIPSGETAEVTLEWTAPANGKPGQPYRQWAEIDTNDAEQPSVTLVVEGELAAPVAAESPVLAFGTVAASQTRTLSTRVLSYRESAAASGGSAATDAPLAIVAPNFDDATTASFFDVKAEPLPASELGDAGAKRGAKLSVTVKPGLPAGPFHQTIRLQTNLADVPPVAVSLMGEIGPDVYVSGPGYSPRTNVMNLGPVDANKAIERRLSLVVFGPAGEDRRPKIALVVPEQLNVTLEGLEQSDDGSRRWPLVVKLAPRAEGSVADNAAAKQPTDGRIVIETGHPSVERIEIGVKFTIKPSD